MKMSWLTYALMTVFFWGVYGVILHMGRGAMPGTPPNATPEGAHAGLKAFLLVCVAYAVIGVIAGFVLKGRGSNFSYTTSGFSISLVAGIAGAAGALTLVLALGAASPIYKAAAAAAVMPIVFGGAPIVNSALAMLLHPPEGGLRALPFQFVLGIILAAAGGVLVAMYAPSNTGGGTAKPAIIAAPVEPKH